MGDARGPTGHPALHPDRCRCGAVRSTSSSPSSPTGKYYDDVGRVSKCGLLPPLIAAERESREKRLARCTVTRPAFSCSIYCALAKEITCLYYSNVAHCEPVCAPPAPPTHSTFNFIIFFLWFGSKIHTVQQEKIFGSKIFKATHHILSI